MKLQTILGTTLALALSAGVAFADSVIATADSASGKILVDGEGLSLYVFDKDTPAVSNCYDDCEAKWPILEAASAARPQGEFGIILRANGDRQWTYKGLPLYTWFQDQEPGDITGDGVKNVWHLARP